MIKTMSNGEYLRLCQKHGVAPIYLDEKPTRRHRKEAKPQLHETFGDGFVLVTPTEPPQSKTTKPLVGSGEPVTQARGKKPIGRVRRRKPRIKRPKLSPEEWSALERLERKEARLFPRPASIECRVGTRSSGGRAVSGGLPGLGRRR